jgi:F-type H+-transporting ATPase subunit b
MFGIIASLLFFFAAGSGGESGFLKFYNQYLNIPGFEVWKFVNLAIFLSILVYILKKPLSEGFKAKRDEIRSDLIRAEEEKKAAVAKLNAIEAKLAQLENERNEILENAKFEAEAEKGRIVQQTESDIARIRQQAASDIARLTAQKRMELRRFAAQESVRLAEVKLKAAIDAATDARLVRASLTEIGGLK